MERLFTGEEHKTVINKTVTAVINDDNVTSKEMQNREGYLLCIKWAHRFSSNLSTSKSSERDAGWV